MIIIISSIREEEQGSTLTEKCALSRGCPAWAPLVPVGAGSAEKAAQHVALQCRTAQPPRQVAGRCGLHQAQRASRQPAPTCPALHHRSTMPLLEPLQAQELEA